MARLIKGFPTYVYMDHKNNLFTEAQLDNRRRSKKMSNWALELQQFDIIRVWIRGEANILADAPSRAPWEAAMARHLPIPDLPLRDLIRKMFVSPEVWDRMVKDKAKKLNLDEWQEMEAKLHPGGEWISPETAPVWKERKAAAEGESEGRRAQALGPPKFSAPPIPPPTPDFGARTPTFGTEEEREFWVQELGPGRIAPGQEWFGNYPRWPVWEPDEMATPEQVFPLAAVERVLPKEPTDLPFKLQRFNDERGYMFAVYWKRAVDFTDNRPRKTLWFSATRYGGKEECRAAAMDYFRDRRDLARGEAPLSGKGPLAEKPSADGLFYHGGRNHTFVCWTDMKLSLIHI